MSEEERKAIEYLKFCTNDFKERYGGETTKQIDIYETILNLIQKLHKENKYIHSELDKQQEKINNYAKEIEKKDKIIDEMAGYLAIIRDCPNADKGANIDCENRCSIDDDIYAECWKLYFERKLENER